MSRHDTSFKKKSLSEIPGEMLTSEENWPLAKPVGVDTSDFAPHGSIRLLAHAPTTLVTVGSTCLSSVRRSLTSLLGERREYVVECVEGVGECPWSVWQVWKKQRLELQPEGRGKRRSWPESASGQLLTAKPVADSASLSSNDPVLGRCSARFGSGTCERARPGARSWPRGSEGCLLSARGSCVQERAEALGNCVFRCRQRSELRRQLTQMIAAGHGNNGFSESTPHYTEKYGYMSNSPLKTLSLLGKVCLSPIAADATGTLLSLATLVLALSVMFVTPKVEHGASTMVEVPPTYTVPRSR